MIFVPGRDIAQEQMEKREKEIERETEARKYLEKHKIKQLFDNLVSLLIYSQPENPRKFLADEAERIRSSRGASAGGAAAADRPSLFNDNNLIAIFDMIDPTGRGTITRPQYEDAMKAIGAIESDVDKLSLESENITKEVFVKRA